MSQVSERYSEAFFKLAQSENKVDLWQQQMSEVNKALASAGETKRFFNAIKISGEEKKQLLEKCFGKDLDTYCLNFLKLLIDKKRINEVNGILNEFHSLCNQSKGVEEGVVESAFPLKEDQLKQLEESYLAKGKKVELKNMVNPTLISGIKIRLSGEEVDMSMRNRIDKMKKELLNEGKCEQ